VYSVAFRGCAKSCTPIISPVGERQSCAQSDELVFLLSSHAERWAVFPKSKGNIYRHEFGDTGQHTQLLELLLSLPCPVAISGYWSSLYGDMLATWRTISYTTRTRGGSSVQEWLWMNYPEPLELHDYRYLGSNFRQRERLKRIRIRWLARLGRMDALERYSLLEAIAEYSGK
jgi:hypothetical protein